jgi:DNA-directed RNA polymerase subunit RPC12/RpoP
MDFGEHLIVAGINIVCPHCGATEADDLEVLDLDELHAIRCVACKRRIHLMIAECLKCGEESVLSWTAVPTPSEIKSAACVRCGSPLTDHGSDVRTLG